MGIIRNKWLNSKIKPKWQDNGNELSCKEPI